MNPGQLTCITPDEGVTSSSSSTFAPRHEGAKTAAVKRVALDLASQSAPESSASEEDRRLQGIGSPAWALREAQMDERMRLRGGRGRQGEELNADVDMACPPESSADAAKCNPLLLRASTESEVVTLRKMAAQAEHAAHNKAAKRSAIGNSSAGPKRKAGRLAERRLRAKMHSKKEKSRAAAAAAREAHSSNLTPPDANVEDREYDSDDMMMHSSTSASESPSTMLTAAALVAAATVAGIMGHEADPNYIPTDSPAYTPYLGHELRRLGSVSSSIDMRVRCNDVYELHLGALPNPIECIRNEIRSPSELRFFRLPAIVAPLPLAMDEDQGPSAIHQKHRAPQSEQAELQSGSQSNELPDNSLDFISMRELEKDWDDWRWESNSSGGESVFLDQLPSTRVPQEAILRT